MIKVCHQAGGQYAFAHYPESDEEEEYWKRLVRQVKYQHSICAVVGLQIVAEFEFCNRHVVVTSVNHKVGLSESDLSSLRAGILTELRKKSCLRKQLLKLLKMIEDHKQHAVP